MILSGGDLGGQEYTEPCAVGDILVIGQYLYRVIDSENAVFEGLTQ
jgi:hypothetical protein